MRKEIDQRSFGEKAGRFNINVGLIAIVAGLITAYAPAIGFGALNVAEGTVVERFFKKRRMKKTPQLTAT